MKKLCLIIFTSLFLVSCSKERGEFEVALTEKLRSDSDMKDYRLDPADMASCVVGEIEKGLPGIKGTPTRDPYFAAYTRFVKATGAAETKVVIDKSTDLFGSPGEARDAALGITSHVMYCMQMLYRPDET